MSGLARPPPPPPPPPVPDESGVEGNVEIALDRFVGFPEVRPSPTGSDRTGPV